MKTAHRPKGNAADGAANVQLDSTAWHSEERCVLFLSEEWQCCSISPERAICVSLPYRVWAAAIRKVTIILNDANGILHRRTWSGGGEYDVFRHGSPR